MDETMSSSRPKVIHRVKNLARKCLPWSRKKSDNINPQLSSPLYNQLPQELRDQIWEYVLEPQRDVPPAHFHIFDEVFDACTYQKPRNGVAFHRARHRKAQEHIALLMSCRRIYHEALHYLYDHAHFTFVVLAGRARQYCSPKYYDRCKNLGKIEDCTELFQRVRYLTIIIQPGKNPHVDLYNARVQRLLKTLDFGRNLAGLRLIFNWRLEIGDHDPHHDHRTKIVEALHPLKHQLTTRVIAGKCKLVILGWENDGTSTNDDTDLIPPFYELLSTIGSVEEESIQRAVNYNRYPSLNSKLLSWNPQSWTDLEVCVRHGADMTCLNRGVFGDDLYALKMLQPATRTPINIRLFPNVSKEELEMGAFVAAYLLTLPISIPLTAWAVIARKKMKGEWK